ncbi:pro-Pol polyprotein [Trichonephila clavipes]|nr:pro-Pol polyprotein [Trichonephila clavipes]
MAPDRLKIAKMEFQHMLDLGHMRPSSSNYSSPLHMVPKKESNDWRPVGDFRALNAQTKKDKYPIPSILDFTSDRHGQEYFLILILLKRFTKFRLLPKTYIKLLFVLHLVSSKALECSLVTQTKKKPSRLSKCPQTPLEWTEEAENSFTAAKTALADATLLKHPIPEDSSIKLEKQYFSLEDVSLYCDKSLESPRPFVPKNLRQVVFQNLHFLSHPGISATTNLISKRFFWLGGRKDIKNRVQACEKCQRAKVFKHTKAPLSTFALPDARFAHIHTDYIGPYPPSKEYKYCLTIIDRYTRCGLKLFLPKTCWQKPLLVHF